LTPAFKRIGKAINNAREGITIQRILLDREITFSIFFVSIYSQIIDSIEIRGIDTIKPPRNVFFFAISETITMITDDMKTLIIV
jgi:hypothetical protein